MFGNLPDSLHVGESRFIGGHDDFTELFTAFFIFKLF